MSILQAISLPVRSCKKLEQGMNRKKQNVNCKAKQIQQEMMANKNEKKTERKGKESCKSSKKQNAKIEHYNTQISLSLDRTRKDPRKQPKTIRKISTEAPLPISQDQTIIYKRGPFQDQAELKGRRVITLPKEEYLLFQDDFLVINDKLGPNQKILATFREVCSDTKAGKSKQIQQDSLKNSSSKPVKLLIHRQKNLFTEARRQIQQQIILKKALKIQKWWRKLKKLPIYAEPRAEWEDELKSEFLDLIQSKIAQGSLHIFRDSLSEVGQKEANMLAGGNFNLSQFEGNRFSESLQTPDNQPRKIELMQDCLKDNIVSYRLPQVETCSQQNDLVFTSNNPICFDQEVQQDDSDESGYEIVDGLEDSVPQHLPECENTSNLKSNLTGNLTGNLKSNLVCAKLAPPPFSVSFEKDECDQDQEIELIQRLIETRLCVQTGSILTESNGKMKLGIDTSIPVIHAFLLKFFRFYVYYFEQELFRNINTPCGHSIPMRLAILRGEPEPLASYEGQDENIYGVKTVIEEEAIQEYYTRILASSESANFTTIDKTNFELEKIHQRALIDAFNDQLNAFRPYNAQKGEPFPWDYADKPLSFYFVTEENIQEVFERTELNTLKITSALCGINIPKMMHLEEKVIAAAPIEDRYLLSNHPMIINANENRLSKQICKEISKQSAMWQDFSGSRTELMLCLSSVVIDCILMEMALEMRQ